MSEMNEASKKALQELDKKIVILKGLLENAITMRGEAASLEFELLTMYRPSLLAELEHLDDTEIIESFESSKPSDDLEPVRR